MYAQSICDILTRCGHIWVGAFIQDMIITCVPALTSDLFYLFEGIFPAPAARSSKVERGLGVYVTLCVCSVGLSSWKPKVCPDS